MIYPCSTVLDDSIGSALWFAARGNGILHHDNSSYESPAEVRKYIVNNFCIHIYLNQ